MKQPKPADAKPADEPTMSLLVKAPVTFFERIDRWCEQQKEAQGMTIRPSRPAAIRYIVHHFLLKQEQSKPKRAGRTGLKRRRP